MEPLVYLINCPPGWIKTPPLGIEYLQKYLEKENVRTRVNDLNITLYRGLKAEKKRWLALDRKFEENLFNYVESKHHYVIQEIMDDIRFVPFIGLSLYKRNSIFTLILAEKIKRAYPDKTIIIGGPHTLFMKIQKKKMSEKFNWVIGEGEIAVRDIIKGKRKGIIVHEELKNLDNLPFLDFKDFNLSLYGSFLPLLSSRGCIKKCRFCAENRLYKSFRQHSPLYIAEQIELLLKKYGINNFSFQDSLINADQGWLEQLCRLIITKNLRINWEAQMAVRKHPSPGLAGLIKKSGCFNLFIGLESASDKVLKLMNKGFINRDAFNFFSQLKKADLHFEISLIFGYPGEEDNDFRETVDFIVKNKKVIPKIAQVNPFVDYFSDDYRISEQSLIRAFKFISVIREERIPYTKSFINNLIYAD